MLSKDEYLDSVGKEIKFKAARKYLRSELAAHIDDKRIELEAAGNSDAEAQAVAMMGDAKEAGKALNALHRPRTDWGVIACMLLLSAAGFFFIRFIQINGIHYLGNWSLENHLRILFMSACILICSYFLNYTLIIKLRYVFFGCALVFIGLYVLEGNGIYMDNLILYALSSQSSVIAFSTLFFLLGIFGFIGRRKNRGFAGLLQILALSSLAILAMEAISATFYSVLIAIITATLLGFLIMTSECKLSVRLGHLAATISLLAAIQILLIKINFYPFIHTWTFEAGIGDVPIRPDFIRDIISTAKFFGPSELYAHYQLMDFHTSGTSNVFTSLIICYGWGAALAVGLVFTAMFAFMANSIRKIKHSFGKALAIGISAYLFIRFAVCVLTNTGIIGGVSCGLPFVSYGYFGFMADSVLIGVFLSVRRRSSFMKDSIALKPAAHSERIGI